MTDTEIKNDLLACVPRFKDYLSKDAGLSEEGIYTYLTGFGIFLIKSTSDNESIIIEQSFKLINKWLSYDDLDLDEKIVICIFEVLTDTKEGQSQSLKLLNQKGLGLFNGLFDRFHKLI